jgi:hypothetical protein
VDEDLGPFREAIRCSNDGLSSTSCRTLVKWRAGSGTDGEAGSSTAPARCSGGIEIVNAA